MKAHLLIAAAVSLAAGTVNAQEPTPGTVRRSAPPPSKPAPAAVTASQPRTSFVPSTAAHRSGSFAGGAYRSGVPNYTPHQFRPTGTMPTYRNWNGPANTVTTGVTPRVGTLPQQTSTTTSSPRTWNPDARFGSSGTRTWNSGRTWTRPTNPNTNPATGNVTNTTNTNDWRTRNPNNYASWQDARRHYDHHRHDRDWWRHHHDHIIFVNNAYYFWDAGWWYPAWGYNPYYDNYAYDGPIYGYDGLPPDQVIARVQSALQQQGYYYGAIDGELGPMTQQALAAWQRDHGLAITTAIDYPTLASLGMA